MVLKSRPDLVDAALQNLCLSLKVKRVKRDLLQSIGVFFSPSPSLDFQFSSFLPSSLPLPFIIFSEAKTKKQFLKWLHHDCGAYLAGACNRHDAEGYL